MATYPASDYPGAPDTDIPVLDATSAMDTTSHWRLHNALRNGLLAVQGALGANPAGSEADVAARIAAVESDVAALPGGVVGDQGQAFVAKLDQRVTPARLAVLGDSTGLGPGEWVDYLATNIGAAWLSRKVTLRRWNSGSSTYDAPSTVANGSATPVLDIYNGSVGGTTAASPVGSIASLIPSQPDLVLINFGHNHGADSVATFLAALDTLVASVRSTWAGAPIAIVSQNPRNSPASNITDHAAREAAKRDYAADHGFGYVGAFEAFQAQTTPSAWVQSDGIHPTATGATNGAELWGAQALRALAALSVQPPSTTSASSVYVYRDRLVAAAGNTLLTLGATPVANSPLVWVNGAIKWPTTDYTISGAVITFNSGLAGSDVVAVQYQSTNATYTAAAMTTAAVNIVDTFTRADSTSALGSTTTGSKAWTQHAGTWGISSNKAYVANGIAGATCLATIDAAVASGTVSVVLTTSGGPGIDTGGIIVRSDGAGNSYVVEVQVGTNAAPKIYKGTAGSYSVLATGSSTTVASGSVLSVVLSGSSITVKDDGVTIVSATDSTWNANTRHGMYVTTLSGASSYMRFDDFSIQP